MNILADFCNFFNNWKLKKKWIKEWNTDGQVGGGAFLCEYFISSYHPRGTIASKR